MNNVGCLIEFDSGTIIKVGLIEFNSTLDYLWEFRVMCRDHDRETESV